MVLDINVINFHSYVINTSEKHIRKYLDENKVAAAFRPYFGWCYGISVSGQRLMRGYKYRWSVLLRGCENAVAKWFYVRNYSITFVAVFHNINQRNETMMRELIDTRKWRPCQLKRSKKKGMPCCCVALCFRIFFIFRSSIIA